MKHALRWIPTVAAMAALLAVAMGYAQVQTVPKLGTVQEVKIVGVVDADTFDCEPVATRFRVRLSNADTWESRRVNRAGSGPISDEELAKGKLARDAVVALMNGRRVLVATEPGPKGQPVRQDNFGRPLAHVWVVGEDGSAVDVGNWLKANGHTRE